MRKEAWLPIPYNVVRTQQTTVKIPKGKKINFPSPDQCRRRQLHTWTFKMNKKKKILSLFFATRNKSRENIILAKKNYLYTRREYILANSTMH